MCFRPADASISPVLCPNCGKRINPTNGIFPKKCPFCKTEFDPEELMGETSNPTEPKAPSATSNLPQPPSVPGAPKSSVR